MNCLKASREEQMFYGFRHTRPKITESIDPGHNDLNDPKYYNILSKKLSGLNIKVTLFVMKSARVEQLIADCICRHYPILLSF